MNYIGSKIKLSAFIYNTVTQIAGNDLSGSTFCDLFAGTGTVGKLFSGHVKKIISNDREYYSYVLNRAYLGRLDDFDHETLFAELNNLKGCPGFIFNEYSENGKAGRLYFSEANGQRIDAIRQKIKQWKTSKAITEDVYYFLLASLIQSADKVANTASVYCAYLKRLKNTAQKEIIIKPIDGVCSERAESKIYNEDSNLLIKKITGDILYLDPPYNGREYGSYYHLLNTIAVYDNTFVPKGKTGLRAYSTSNYCRKKEAAKALAALIGSADFRYIFLSYNNEGLIAIDTIRAIMERYGKYAVSCIPYTKFKSQGTQPKATTMEYIHVLSKR